MIDLACVFSALFFLLANIMEVVYIRKEFRRGHFDVGRMMALEPAYIIEEWDHRTNRAALANAANAMGAFAWLLFTIPMVQFAWAMSMGGRRKIWAHAGIAMFSIGGAFTEFIARTMIFGSFTAAKWIYNSWDLNNWTTNGDGMGYKVLEICFTITRGALVWVDAFEFIALFLVLTLIFYSVGTKMPSENFPAPFGRCWASMGAIIAFLSFVDFALNVLRIEDWPTFTGFALFVSLVIQGFCFPIWLVWMGRILPSAIPRLTAEQDILFQRPVVDANGDQSPVA